MINDIQVYNYDVKIFMEFFLGVGFAINQAVFCSTSLGSGSGLQANNSLYFS
jgi:hypothetical protein